MSSQRKLPPPDASRWHLTSPLIISSHRAIGKRFSSFSPTWAGPLVGSIWGICRPWFLDSRRPNLAQVPIALRPDFPHTPPGRPNRSGKKGSLSLAGWIYLTAGPNPLTIKRQQDRVKESSQKGEVSFDPAGKGLSGAKAMPGGRECRAVRFNLICGLEFLCCSPHAS